MGTRREPTAAGHWAAAALVVLAGIVLVGAVGQALLGREKVDVRPFHGTSGDVTIRSHPVAIWVSPPGSGGRCSLLDDEGRDRTADRLSPDPRVSSHGRRWRNAFVVDGPNGTVVHVRCSEIAPGSAVGWSPEPAVARRFVVLVTGIAIAAVLLLTALGISVITAVRRSRARRSGRTGER